MKWWSFTAFGRRRRWWWKPVSNQQSTSTLSMALADGTAFCRFTTELLRYWRIEFQPKFTWHWNSSQTEPKTCVWLSVKKSTRKIQHVCIRREINVGAQTMRHHLRSIVVNKNIYFNLLLFWWIVCLEFAFQTIRMNFIAISGSN